MVGDTLSIREGVTSVTKEASQHSRVPRETTARKRGPTPIVPENTRGRRIDRTTGGLGRTGCR